jgi:hypothetical protein
MPRQNSGWSNSKENEMKRGFKMCGVREAERCISYFFLMCFGQVHMDVSEGGPGVGKNSQQSIRLL